MKSYSKKYVFTTFSLGSEINFELYQLLIDYCFREKAELIVLTTDGNGRGLTSTYPLQERHLEHAYSTGFEVFNGLQVHSPRIKPHQNLIVRGTAYQAKKGNTLIVPCNRHDLMSLPTDDNSSMFIIGTGSLSKRGGTYGRSGTAIKAEALHSFGALIVEVEDVRMERPVFYWRQVQYCSSEMAFCDLNKKYFVKVNDQGEPKTMNAEGELHTGIRTIPASKVVFAPGDLHAPRHDPKVLQSIKNLADEFKGPINSIILQDGMDQGYSYNHHQTLIGKAQQFENNKSRMIDERAETLKIFKELELITKQLIHIPSNHDDVIERFVTDHRHILDKDYVNYREAQILGMIKYLGINVYEFYLNHLGMFLEFSDGLSRNFNSGKKNKNIIFDLTPELNNSKFIPVGSSYKVNDISIFHGDKGANGGRSLKAIPSLGPVLSGHTHSPFIIGDHWCVGTSSLLDLGYNKGIGSWSQSMCLIHLHKDGTTTRQMLTLSQITGKLSLKV